MNTTASVTKTLVYFLMAMTLVASVVGMNVNVLPASPAVGAPHAFVVQAGITMAALVTLIAAFYGVEEASVQLFFGGRPIQALNNLGDIPGFQHGYTMLLVIRDAAVQAVQALQADPPAAVDQAIIDKARHTHDVTWGRIANYDIGNNPNVDPLLPDHHERNYMLTVALILTHDIPGIVGIVGVPGNDDYYSHCILAIMYYYRQKGWPALREEFIRTVYEQL